MSTSRLKVAFLVGGDTQSTRESIAAVCAVAGVEPVGILLDTHQLPLKSRLRNLRRNIRREGIGYIGKRLLGVVRDWLDGIADRLVDQYEVEQLMRRAFPREAFTLPELADQIGCPLERVGNLNHSWAAERLRALGADLGVVLGTRVLKRSTFGVPPRGSINLHKGEVPRFRGLPPAFWELFEGVAEAGVTVHYVDEGLDTGAVIGAGRVKLHPRETWMSLRRKLDELGSAVLADTVARLLEGEVAGQPQPAGSWPTRTRPTAAQLREFEARVPSDGADSDLRRILKTALHLGQFYTGIWWMLRHWRTGLTGRGGIILHHRVNSRSWDALTTQTRVLAEQLVVLKRYYQVVKTTELVRCIQERRKLPDGAVAIHFDDCYRDVYQCAAPLLKAADAPGTMFIATGFIDTDRMFAHDEQKYALRFENLRSEEVSRLARYGVEVGAHTVNHVDLGVIPAEQAHWELAESKRRLEELTGQEIRLFSFPFGKESNIRDQVRRMVREGGFDALFSAHGGGVSKDSDPYDIHRFGCNSRYRAIDLMMELEGISLHHWAQKLLRLLK
ncbi:MAG: polysaccharide deacetylase family protein [Acidobacteriota bacterium]